MTALNNLLLEFARRINQHNISGLSEMENKFLVEELEQKYSVTFRNNNSTADNIKPEQSINQEQIGLAIRGLLHRTLGDKVDPFELKVFKQLSDDIIDIVNKSITDEELVSKIESMIVIFNVESKKDIKNPVSCSIIAKERVIEKLLNLFKTYRTMPNSDQNNSGDK